MFRTALDIVRRFVAPYSELIEDIGCIECGYTTNIPVRYLDPNQVYHIACPNCGMQYEMMYMWGKWRLSPMRNSRPIHASERWYEPCGVV